MNTFAKEMAFYSAYHQQNTNIWIHVFGVPLITFTAFVPLSWVQLFELGGIPFTFATAFYLFSMYWYFRLDALFASLAVVIYGLLLYAAHQAAQMGYVAGAAIFLAGQIIGWTSQIYGHLHFERNRPAFFENLFQSFVSAPLFVIADVCFHLGLKQDLQDAVKQELVDTGRLREEFHQPAGPA